MRLDELDAELGAVPGTVSVYCGRIGVPPVYVRNADVTHYAASTVKVSILVALHLAAEEGRLSLDEPISVHNGFRSAVDGSPFGCTRGYDNDGAVWERLGGTATPRWLAERMIVRSSNLATNLVLAQVGTESADGAWRLAGASHSTTGRGIEDYAADAAGITNLVTAADLAAILTGIATGTVASAASCRAMLATLLAQEGTQDLAAGLPPGTRIAHKNGWIDGVRHGAGVVFPDDAPPYALAVCTTTPLAVNDADDEACRLLARIAAASWAQRRHPIG